MKNVSDVICDYLLRTVEVKQLTNLLTKLLEQIAADTPGCRETINKLEKCYASLKYPNRDGLLVLALSSYYIRNYEIAALIAARTCRIFPDDPIATLMVLIALETMQAPETSGYYISNIAGCNSIEVGLHYYCKAKYCLAMNDMDRFDHYLIRRIALKKFGVSQLNEIGWARTKAIQMTPAKTVETWQEYISDKFLSENDKSTKFNIRKWRRHPNKKQLAAYISSFCDRIINRKSPTIIDFGCHAGTLDGMIRQGSMKKINLIGIDRDRIPIEMAQNHYPKMRFYAGGHEKLLEMDMPADLLIMSFVCCLNNPMVIDKIAEYASRKVSFVILAEDISNMYGNFAVFRRHYMIHPYYSIFAKYGFDLLDKEILIDPNEAANGILAFRNTKA